MTARVVPYYCPYCGEQDLRPFEPEGDSDVALPDGDARGIVNARGWHCADCTRVFAVKYHGMAAAPVIAPPPTGSTSPGKHP